MRLIDADALKKEVKHRCVLSPLDAPWPLAYGNTDLPEIIDQMPTIEAEPIKHGKWVHKYGDGHTENAITGGECSICGFVNTATHYCPHCGAKMDEVE